MGNFFPGVGLSNSYLLQKALFDKYGPADKRHKKPEKTTFFRVDGCELYTGADGNPLSHVCMIFAEVRQDGRLHVRLSGNVPLEGPVQEWIGSVGAGLGASTKQAPGLSFMLQKGQQEALATLAKAMQGVVIGRTYSTASFKYTCPRISGALAELKSVLDSVWA